MVMCKVGCGFFGSEKFDSFCSKCFKEHCGEDHRTLAALPAAAPVSAPRELLPKAPLLAEYAPRVLPAPEKTKPVQTSSTESFPLAFRDLS
ncbi:hypothetical protein L596_012378 [Steinernema carpocapsae]|uniref:A20-type domain-containing protein n=1 Tax=Steinernema carpocapsae TaxID=34508 RepID=A0A4U5NXR5_STECR|nr:hypothetical protein L596_012378 [Steinernema carpocapsae]